MKQITLENFKIFGKPTHFDLGPITILTGKNSSGKSSFIKALLFLADFHSKGMMIVNDFNGNLSNKHKIRSFNDLKSWNNEADIVSFKYKIGPYYIRYSFTPSNDNTLYYLSTFSCVIDTKIFEEIDKSIPLVFLSIHDDIYELHVDPTFLVIHSSVESFSRFQELNALIDEIEIAKKVGAQSSNLKKQVKKINQIKKYFGTLLSDIENKKIIKIEGSWQADPELPLFNISIGELLITGFDKYLNSLSKRKDPLAVLNYFQKHALRKIDYGVFKIDYTGPDRVGSNRVYILSDKTFQMSDVLEKYRVQLALPNERFSGDSYFLEKWLKEFGIGEEIKVEYFEDQVGIIKIIKDGNKVDLSDLGFGISQIVCLLIKLQVIMNDGYDSGQNEKPDDSSSLLIIEEPESNLHPDLQSKLADLFYDTANSYTDRWPQIIVETHSEYLIRRTQVLVKEKGLQNNPFKVYYFDSEKGPYEMKYREDGIFENDFGSGFFDEADTQAIKLLRKS